MRKSAYLACILLVVLLVSPKNGAAETVENPEASAEVADKDSVLTTSDGLEKALAYLSALAPPPQLSDRELGLHTVSCSPGTAPGSNEVEGESYSCGVFTVPQNWDNLDGGVLFRHRDLFQPAQHPTLDLGIAQAVEHHQPDQRLGIELPARGAKRPAQRGP